jgi:hypothetical protein
VSTVGESVMKMAILPLTAGALSSSQLNILQKLTPKVLYSLTDWSCDLQDIPNINEIDVKRYLLQTNILSADYERTYKLSRPYQLKQFVNTVQTCTWSSLFCIIRARCLPSQSTNSDDVKLMHVIIDKSTGQPYGGYCTCTVGYGIPLANLPVENKDASLLDFIQDFFILEFVHLARVVCKCM